MDEKRLDEIIEKYSYPAGRTLGVLREIQIQERHIPIDTLKLVSEKLDLPLSELFALVTFYSFFSLKPVGEHLITVCIVLFGGDESLSVAGRSPKAGHLFPSGKTRTECTGLGGVGGFCRLDVLWQDSERGQAV